MSLKRWTLRLVLMGFLALAGGVGFGQAASGQAGGLDVPAGTVEGVLLGMANQAGVIFAGQVVSVTRADGNGYVDVAFRVDQAVRGCDTGGTYTVREWAGLWVGQTERYRVGQRLLMLLTAKGAGGMSAPVNGMDGAIPVVANVAPPLMRNGVVPADTGVDEAGGLVDLRWIRARVTRGIGSGTSAASGNAVQAQVTASWVPVTGTPFQPISDWVGPIAPMPPGGPGSTTEPSLSSVLVLLAGQH
ncbi:hypothetical protein [Granulicella tundricola]|uniref:hypothetical protein n=1 Tax=Granulicella tundricola TaxID=940615 RepID=UPI0018DDEB07|nr:hypothetical protein [Granulicella tundricola]